MRRAYPPDPPGRGGGAPRSISLPATEKESAIRKAAALVASMLAAAACGGGAGSSTTSASPTLAAAPTTLPGNPSWFEGLEAGMCFDNVFRSGEFDFASPPAVVPCDGPHDNEIAALVDLPGAGNSFPGEEAVSEAAADGCDDAYQEFLGRPLPSTFLAAFVVWPDDDDWNDGAHQAVCALYSEAPLVGTAASDALTADGETLAVLYEKDGVLDLRLMDGATGTVTADLTRGDFPHVLRSQPSWAPDGSSVAFAAKPEGSGPENDGDLYVAALDGRGILPLLEGPGEEDRPVIGPVGTVVAFISDREGGEFDIYTIDFGAGGLLTRLTIHPDRDSSPTWSPDGTRIAFRRRAGGNSDIYVMNVDGSDARRLTNDPAFDGDPQWSPDGAQILFTTDRAGNFDIWVMSVDGSEQTPLTNHPANDEYPAWSRDGEYIAFQSTRHGITQIWLMRRDGSEQSLLGTEAPTGYPAWAPVQLGS